MILGIDIDNTITDTRELIIEYGLKYINENNLPHPDYSSGYLIEEVFGWDQPTVDRFLEQYLVDIYDNVKPKKDALEVLRELKKDHRLVLITSRNRNHPFIRECTLKWLINNNIEYSALVMNPTQNLHHFSKLASCREHQIDIMIDDHHDLCLEIAQEIPVIMFDQVYNRHVNAPNITRVKSWLEIKRIIDRWTQNRRSGIKSRTWEIKSRHG
ncbi:MAG: 5' nucleotidase, NT5C type [Syntrophomonadaceae bacterium]|jgi:uncharacterized HAD superfamily protein